jgi:hypothetical protein
MRSQPNQKARKDRTFQKCPAKNCEIVRANIQRYEHPSQAKPSPPQRGPPSKNPLHSAQDLLQSAEDEQPLARVLLRPGPTQVAGEVLADSLNLQAELQEQPEHQVRSVKIFKKYCSKIHQRCETDEQILSKPSAAARQTQPRTKPPLHSTLSCPHPAPLSSEANVVLSAY